MGQKERIEAFRGRHGEIAAHLAGGEGGQAMTEGRNLWARDKSLRLRAGVEHVGTTLTVAPPIGFFPVDPDWPEVDLSSTPIIVDPSPSPPSGGGGGGGFPPPPPGPPPQPSPCPAASVLPSAWGPSPCWTTSGCQGWAPVSECYQIRGYNDGAFTYADGDGGCVNNLSRQNNDGYLGHFLHRPGWCMWFKEPRFTASWARAGTDPQEYWIVGGQLALLDDGVWQLALNGLGGAGGWFWIGYKPTGNTPAGVFLRDYEYLKATGGGEGSSCLWGESAPSALALMEAACP